MAADRHVTPIPAISAVPHMSVDAKNKPGFQIKMDLGKGVTRSWASAIMNGSIEMEKEERCGFDVGNDVFDRWWRVGTAKGLVSDAQIAGFLLDQYDSVWSRAQTPPHCLCCNTPLALLCTRCNLPAQHSHSVEESPATTVATAAHAEAKVKRKRGPPSFQDSSETEQFTLQESGSTTEHSLGKCGRTMEHSLENSRRTMELSLGKSGKSMEHSLRKSWRSTEHSLRKSGRHNNQLSLQKSGKSRLSPSLATFSQGKSHSKECVELYASGVSCIPNAESSQSDSDNELHDIEVSFGQVSSAANKNSVSLNLLSFPSQEFDKADAGLLPHSYLSQESETADALNENTLKSSKSKRDTRLDSHSSHSEEFDKTETDEENIERPLSSKTARNSKPKVRQRRRRGTGHIPIVCSECPASFTRRSDLEKHTRKHTGERPFRCELCPASYTQNNNLKFHIQSQHTGERPWVCDECGVACIRKCDLKVHMQKHSGLRPYVCEQCNTSFAQKGALRVHMRIHTNDRPYLCKQCGAAFRQEGNLQRHMRTHTGERPFKCSKCQASFAENGTLKIHMRKHTGDRPFVCDFCAAAFTARGALNIHRRTHTGDRPYICGDCSAKFTHNGALKRHERTHTGDKPHVCAQCGTAFAESYALKNHVRKVHKAKEESENVAADSCCGRKNHNHTAIVQVFVNPVHMEARNYSGTTLLSFNPDTPQQNMGRP